MFEVWLTAGSDRVTILETVEEIFSNISVPQNVAKKVARLKVDIEALERRNANLESQATLLKIDLNESKVQSGKLKAENKRLVAGFLNPEQGHPKPLPQVILGHPSRRR